MQPLVDGFYSVVVLDASEDTARAGLHLELAITQGPAKGEVVSLRALSEASTTRSAIDLLGLPATLEVRDGVPRIIFDSV